MKIAILEFETHTHLLLQWNALLQNSGIDYHFYISSSISCLIPEIPDSLKTVLEVKDYPQLSDFLADNDLIIFNTLHRNFQKFNFLFKEKNTQILVHNGNFFFNSRKPDWKLFLKVKNLHLQYYYLKLIFKENIYFTKKIICEAKAYAFLNENIKQHFSTDEKKYITLPLIYNKFNVEPSEQNKINIVIPGEVSQSRRNYQLVFKLLKYLSPKQIMKFTFLGKISDQSMLQSLHLLKKNRNNSVEISYFRERIPQSEFDLTMNESHFVLCPLHKETQFYLQKEIYGQTKASGNEADCISYGKIGIFPQHYPLSNWNSLYYDSAENLKTILENLTIQEYHKLKNNLEAQLPYYDKEKVKEKLINMLTILSQS
ncbi:hypothetical protein [Apibacter sp. HY039]|uniref:hypothetical protein n=1 Tax=Apibacter sp. HY039 TaxID=2501476 RepID=UPI000FEB6B57|nr:hypothetical protein [Apibacter sp. HY039]